MAMSGDDMGIAVARAIMEEAGGDASQKGNVERYWKVICNAIVEHIQSNAKVKSGIQVSTSAGSGTTVSTGDIE